MQAVIDFSDKVLAVFLGQNLTTGPQKVAFMRTVLKGDALSHFSQYFLTAESENNDTFEASICSLITHIFPLRALRIQKRYMRWYMRNPRDMKMRTYCNRVIELNNYLARFPSNFNDAQKIDEEELVDILEFGTPNKWQYKMVCMGFDSATSTSQELVEFCERLEFTEELSNSHEKTEAMPKPGPSGGKMGRCMRSRSPHVLGQKQTIQTTATINNRKSMLLPIIRDPTILISTVLYMRSTGMT